VFFLHEDPAIAAEYHYDKHVISAIPCVVRILSAVQCSYGKRWKWLYSGSCNREVVSWVEKSEANYHWLWKFGMALCAEFTVRFNNVHKSHIIIERLSFAPEAIRNREEGLTRPPQTIPDIYKHEDTSTAYWGYYREEKRHLLKYTNRERPVWLNAIEQEELQNGC